MTAANVATRATSLPSRMNTKPDRRQHRGLAEAVERGIEECPEDGPLARRPRERAVEDVCDQPDHEETLEPEVGFSFLFSNPTSTAPARAERHAREGQHVRRQLRLGDAAHRPGEDLARGGRVYSCLTRSSWLTRAGLPPDSSSLMRAEGSLQGERPCREAALEPAMPRPQSRPYRCGYGRSLRPGLTASLINLATGEHPERAQAQRAGAGEARGPSPPRVRIRRRRRPVVVACRDHRERDPPTRRPPTFAGASARYEHDDADDQCIHRIAGWASRRAGQADDETAVGG